MQATNWTRQAERLLKLTPAPGVVAGDLAEALSLATVRTLKPD